MLYVRMNIIAASELANDIIKACLQGHCCLVMMSHFTWTPFAACLKVCTLAAILVVSAIYFLYMDVVWNRTYV